MQQEIEAKFLNVDLDEVRSKLQDAGAVCEQPMRLMRRVVVDYPDMRMQKGDSWVRIRDEGHKVTLTYKKSTEKEFGGAHEIEVEVSDYQKTIDIFLSIGLVTRTSQETKRETWRLGDTEIVLDEWPWIPPYIEIEGASESDVQSVAEQLGFDWSEAVFGTVIMAYEAVYPGIKDLGVKFAVEPEVRFNVMTPDWLMKGKK